MSFVMNSRYLIIAVFLSGLASGWFGKGWFESHQLNIVNFINSITGDHQSISENTDSISADSSLAVQSELATSVTPR